MTKPILCLDFDGVLHSYTSGWKGADTISDPPVPGAMKFISEAVNNFTVQIFSSRSSQPGGRNAMQCWVGKWLCSEFQGDGHDIADQLAYPTEKPAAFITIDDRALTFTGEWPTMEALKEFKPWNKKPPATNANPS